MQTFAKALRFDRGDLPREWREDRAKRVTAAVFRWMAENDLEIDFLPSRGADQATQASAPTTEGGDLDHVRGMLHRAIDRMPQAELLRLMVPLEYLIDEAT